MESKSCFFRGSPRNPSILLELPIDPGTNVVNVFSSKLFGLGAVFFGSWPARMTADMFRATGGSRRRKVENALNTRFLLGFPPNWWIVIVFNHGFVVSTKHVVAFCHDICHSSVVLFSQSQFGQGNVWTDLVIGQRIMRLIEKIKKHPAPVEIYDTLATAARVSPYQIKLQGWVLSTTIHWSFFLSFSEANGRSLYWIMWI